MAEVDSRLAGSSALSRGFYALVRSLVVLLCVIVTRVRVHGRENIPLQGAFVLAPIHRSNIDTP
ncbi:MAG: hypothetical protein RI912_482, partial [Actinomycetota bacterium]